MISILKKLLNEVGCNMLEYKGVILNTNEMMDIGRVGVGEWVGEWGSGSGGGGGGRVSVSSVSE
jgi:hypothetical protein